MPDQVRDGLDLRTASVEQINTLMRQGAIQALREHKRAGHSVIVWDRENDRIVTVPPEEIEIPEEAQGRDDLLP